MVQIVAAHNEIEVVVGVTFGQHGQCGHGVGWGRQVHLYVTGSQPVVIIDGTSHHFESVMACQERFSLFEGILWRHDEPHLVETGVLQHGVGYNQVSHMNGIERAKEQPNVFHGIGVIRNVGGMWCRVTCSGTYGWCGTISNIYTVM